MFVIRVKVSVMIRVRVSSRVRVGFVLWLELTCRAKISVRIKIGA